MNLETFAAERDATLTQMADLLRPAVREALRVANDEVRHEQLLDAALSAYEVSLADLTGNDTPFGVTSFASDINEAITLITPDGTDAQVDRVANWMATAALGAATLAAGGPNSTKTWVTMLDEDVRHTHAELHATTIDSTDFFTVGTEPPAQMMYPGQPVGPIEAWINCRCVLAIDAPPLTAAAAPGQFAAAVIVALPEGDGMVTYNDGDTCPIHQTLAYLGPEVELTDEERAGLHNVTANLASGQQPFSAHVSGKGTLGDMQDEIIITEAAELQGLRDALTADPVTSAILARADTHPTWISHVTGLDAAAGDEVAYDRLGLWIGDERTTYPLGMQENLQPEGGDESEIASNLHYAEMDDPPVPDEPLDGRTDEVLEWHAVIAPVGVRSGDGRTFTELTHRDLPLPLEWQEVTAPEHDGSVIVGTQRQMAQVGSEWRAAGTWLDSDKADQVIGLIGEGALRSVSVQLDDAEAAISDDEEGVDYSGRICATTIVNVGAFPECWIKLGPAPAGFFGEEALAADGQNSTDNGTVLARQYDTQQRKDMAKRGTAMPDGSFPIADVEDLRNAIQAIGRASDPDAAKRHIRKRARALGQEELIPDTWASEGSMFKRGAGWVTHPEDTRRIHAYWTRGKGAAKIRWGVPGDFNRCRRQLAKYVEPRFLNRTCAQWHHDAIGIWPGQETGGGRSSSLEGPPPALLARGSRAPVPSAYFTNPNLAGPTALTIDGDELFGHLAVFGTCHIGFPGECTEPPRSAADYAFFHTGVVDTDAGPLPIGVITMNTGHADMHDGSADAVAHYDHTGTQVAVVRAGEDRHGIWVHGKMRRLTDDQLDRFQAATLSGDWRKIGGRLELVAALAVNVPGFPVPRTAMAASAGEVIALVAAGVVQPTVEATISDLTDMVVAELDRRTVRKERLAAMEPTAKYARQRRAAALVSAVES